MQLVVDDELHLVSALADLCHKDRTPLATAMLRVFRFERKEALLLRDMNNREIGREEETSTLFRTTSLTTTLMDHYMRSTGHEFLLHTVHSSILRVMDGRQSCELNPSKLDSPSEACANAEHLLSVLDGVVEAIFSSVDHCPRTLRYICYCLQKRVAAKWPHDHLAKTRVVR